MQFADLTDCNFNFECSFAGDAIEYWDYDFFASVHDEHYHRHLSVTEIEQLRHNCKKILKATDNIVREY